MGKILYISICDDCPYVDRKTGMGDRLWCKKLNETTHLYSMNPRCPLDNVTENELQNYCPHCETYGGGNCRFCC